VADVPIIDLDPYLASVEAVLQALQAAGLIPNLDPLDYIISAFDGKPKLEDTELAALRLQSSPWWPLRALGNNLQIWVRNGVPLSTGIAADRQELSQWIQGTIDSIEPIVFNRFNPYSLDHAIWLAMTSQFGDQAIRQLNDEIANQHALGPLPAVPPQPGQPPPTPSGVGVHLSRDGDELADYGDTIIFQNSLLYDLLTQIGKELGSSQVGQCCAHIVTAIGVITNELTAIAKAIAGSGSAAELVGAIEAIATAINVSTGFVKQLADCLCALQQNLSTAGVDLTPLVDAVNKLAAVIQNMPADVAAQVKRLADGNDVAEAKVKAAIQYWRSLGIGDPAVNQIVLS
jgi:hypothetical protein